MNRLTYLLAAGLICTALQGCFTGVESTPRIGEGELRRQHVTSTPEQAFLADVEAERPAQWKPGKQFYVADSKISLIFTSASTGIDSLGGEVLTFCRFDSVPAVDTHTATEVVLTHGRDTLRWRPGFDYTDLTERRRLDLPFTVDLDLVSRVRSQMAGKTYYITTPLWYEPSTMQSTAGLRHVPVQITDVRPGTPEMPLCVLFRPLEDGADMGERAVLMTIGNDRLATRNFYRLFAFENPRKRYPLITDEVWQLIINSKVQEGMTRDECRLALGAPIQIVHGSGTMATIERWSYPDGVYLIFDDGVLSRFRL